MKTCGIYKITNKLNGKFYIGSSVHIENRWKLHISSLKRGKHDNQHLQYSWNKYGELSFDFIVMKECDCGELILEEQKELDIHYGKDYCYNLSPSADVAMRGIPRSDDVKMKCSVAQKGVPRWTNEQKKQMSIDRKGKYTGKDSHRYGKHFNHTEEVKRKISEASKNQKWSIQRCENISLGKLRNKQELTDEERKNISVGVQKAIQEGRYHKNKVPKEQYDTIKALYLSGTINKRQLAFKYGITSSSMQKLLTRIGI